MGSVCLAPEFRARRVVFNLEFAKWVGAEAVAIYTWAMMTIYAVLYFAILTAFTGIETSQKRNGIDLVFGRFVLVLETARVALRTWPSQIMIVAKLVAVFPFLDAVQRGL
jgi:hypothetical protein